MYSQTLPADHQLVWVACVRLGRALARQHRYSEAEVESSTGYQHLLKLPTPPAEWVQGARQDLLEEVCRFEGAGQSRQSSVRPGHRRGKKQRIAKRKVACKSQALFHPDSRH